MGEVTMRVVWVSVSVVLLVACGDDTTTTGGSGGSGDASDAGDAGNAASGGEPVVNRPVDPADAAVFRFRAADFRLRAAANSMASWRDQSSAPFRLRWLRSNQTPLSKSVG